MFGYSLELKSTVEGLMSTGQSFDVMEVKELLDEILGDRADYHDPVEFKDVKVALVSIFENGGMPGYSLVTKPMVGAKGPFFMLEFTPENPMSTLVLIEKPEKDGKRLTCIMHPQYKDMIKTISQIAGCNQDTLMRSILIKGVNMIREQLK